MTLGRGARKCSLGFLKEEALGESCEAEGEREEIEGPILDSNSSQQQPPCLGSVVVLALSVSSFCAPPTVCSRQCLLRLARLLRASP